MCTYQPKKYYERTRSLVIKTKSRNGETGCTYISSSVIFAQAHPDAKQAHHIREKDLDDVLQISNVFMNVSKGEVAKANDLKKSFGTDDRNTIAREVRGAVIIILA